MMYMPDPRQIKGRAIALRSLGDLWEKVQEVDLCFREAGLPRPEEIARFFGEAETEDKFDLPPLPMPPKPPEYVDGWVFVAASEVTPSHLIFGILRGSRTPLQPAQIHQRLSALIKDVTIETVLKVGRRDTDTIDKGHYGWKLADPSSAPVLFEGFAWAPPEVFTSQELASYRRMVVKHALKSIGKGVTVIQMVRSLTDFPDFKLPVTRDSIGGDFAALEREGIVEQDEITHDWKLVAQSQENEQHEKKLSANGRGQE
jgi:hypothetical protein